MKKIENFIAVFIAIAAIGIIGFWVFGIKEMNTACAISFFSAGVAALVADILIFFNWVRSKNGYIG